VARQAASAFGVTQTEAASTIDRVVGTIRSSWDEVCDQAQLTTLERSLLWGREILNEYIFWDQA
jgi:serine/threonine-protein kinase HipA